MSMTAESPQVGIGVLIERDGKILFGKRKNAHGEGCWCFPGGHLEFGESWEECARRETKEETGLEVQEMEFFAATNDIFSEENKHYITIYMRARSVSGEPRVCEPHKCERWEWFDWDALPSPLFIPIENLIAQGFDPREK